MRKLRLRDGNSLPVLIVGGIVAVVVTTLALPGCNVNVKKDGEGQEKKVDIQTPLGHLHVSKEADVRDTGLPVYPGARRKEKGDDGNESSANVNISSNLFGLRVVAVEYLSDDPPEKLIAYYTGQLKKYGNVLECHTSKADAGADVDPDPDSSDAKPLKCEGDNQGKVVELKVGTKQNQHIVSVHPADSGKGSDFGLVYVQVRGGKDTI
jgi:hypothetical protein